MEHRGTFDRFQCQDGVVLAVLSVEHTHGMPTHTNYRWLRASTVNSLPFIYMKRYFTIYGKGDIIVFGHGLC